MREINLKVTPGSYVAAISGGVDSVVLLKLLQQMPGVSLTVAHFDHGIRVAAAEDRQFVQELALFYGLPFVYEEGKLGASASEATAREARYAFLRRVMRDRNAKAIITAHHEDDLLETAILNLLRGTGRKGLSSLQSTHDVVRPMLAIPKQDIIAYANDQGLKWHEDSTNMNTVYLRNYVRHKLMPHFDAATRLRFRKLLDMTADTNTEIDTMLTEYLNVQPSTDTLKRYDVVMLPHAVSKELIAAWLRAHGVRSFDKKTIERITVAAKTYAPGKQVDVDANHVIKVNKDTLALTLRER